MRDSSWLSAHMHRTMMNSQCLPLPTLSMLPTSAPQFESASDWHCSQIDIKQERPDHMMDHDSSATSGVGSNSGASPGGCSSASSERSPSAPAQTTAPAPGQACLASSTPAPGQACLASPTPASATSPRSGSTLHYDPLQSLQGLAPESARRSPTSPPTPADENSRSSEGSYDEGENQSEHMDTSSRGNQSMTPGNVLRCHICDFTDTSRDVMSEHMAAAHYETQDPGLSPDEADDGDYDETSLSTPKYNAQGKMKTFRCKNCGFITLTKVEFWEHHRTHIKDDRVLECPRCPFVTEYKHHLEYHLRNHFNSKPYKCDKCSYACVNKSMLNSHLKSHSNVYQYHCQDCAYATKYCHSLKLHLRKYGHRPSVVLNADGTPNPLPIIDVYGTRRGPKNKSNVSPATGTIPSQAQQWTGSSPAQPSPVPQPTSQITPTQIFPFGLIPPALGYQTPAVRRCPYCEFYSPDAEQYTKHVFLHTDPSVIHFLQANNNNNNNNNPEGLKDYLTSLMWQQSNMGRPQIQAQRAQSAAPPHASPQVPPTAPHTPPPIQSPPVTSSPTPTPSVTAQAPSSPTSAPVVTKPARPAAPLDLSMPETSSNDDTDEVQRTDANTPAALPGSKNRRKGRAYKLERIAMLLQQQSGDESESVSAAAAFAAAAAAAASQPSPPSSPQSPAATPAPPTSVQEAYNCTYCDITFKDVVMYTMHMGYHGYQDPFLCNMCGQQTTDKVSFFLHVARSSHC